MADEEDGFALLLERADNPEKVLNLSPGEGAGGFVHDDQLGIEAERLGDFHHMPLGDTQVLDQGIGVDVQLHAAQQLSGLLSHSLPIELLGARIAQMVSHEDILGHRKLRKHRGFLMDCHDASRLGIDGIAERHFLSVEREGPAGWDVHTGEHFHQGRLPCPVLSDQSMHFPTSEGEMHIVQGSDTGKYFREVMNLQQCVWHCSSLICTENRRLPPEGRSRWNQNLRKLLRTARCCPC